MVEVEGGGLMMVSWVAGLGIELGVLFHLGSGGLDFGPLGLLACLGAGGGLSAPAVYSKMGRSRSITLCRSANACPLSSGIHVPSQQC